MPAPAIIPTLRSRKAAKVRTRAAAKGSWTPPMPKKPLIKRHPIISAVALIFLAPIFAAMMVGMVKGLSDSVSGPGTVNIVHTDSYNDCLTLARDDNFAPEVCEGLNPTSDTAKVNCAYETLHHMPLVDCPTAATTSTPATSSQVVNFNDGFSTAKQDDCQQGDTNACTWLKSTKP